MCCVSVFFCACVHMCIPICLCATIHFTCAVIQYLSSCIGNGCPLMLLPQSHLAILVLIPRPLNVVCSSPGLGNTIASIHTWEPVHSGPLFGLLSK